MLNDWWDKAGEREEESRMSSRFLSKTWGRMMVTQTEIECGRKSQFGEEISISVWAWWVLNARETSRSIRPVITWTWNRGYREGIYLLFMVMGDLITHTLVSGKCTVRRENGPRQNPKGPHTYEWTEAENWWSIPHCSLLSLSVNFHPSYLVLAVYNELEWLC